MSHIISSGHSSPGLSEQGHVREGYLWGHPTPSPRDLGWAEIKNSNRCGSGGVSPCDSR